MEAFTKEEKWLIAKYLNQPPRRLSALFDYGVYVVPSILMAGYGLWVRDYVAVGVGYVALLIMVVAYLGYQHAYSTRFHSVMRKYEERCSALAEKSDADGRGPATVEKPPG